MDFNWSAIIGSLATCGITAALARAFIQRSFKDLECVVDKISEIKGQLAVIAVKLETAEKQSSLLYEHDRKIAAMEQIVYGNHWQARAVPPAR